MKMNRVFLLAGVLALAACKPGTNTGAANDSARAAAPVAVVNGVAISRETFDVFVRNAAGKPSSELTAEQREQVLDSLVRSELTAQQAVKDGIEKDSETAAALELARQDILQQALRQKFLQGNEPTERELRAEYESQLTRMPKEEFRARHILVQTKDDAKDIIARLKKGEKFDQLARKQSIEPAASQTGGELGWFKANTMVKPFIDGLKPLKKGEITAQPVRSELGWHVIQLQDTRPVRPPSFDETRERIRQIVVSRKFKAYQDDLLKAAKVEKQL